MVDIEFAAFAPKTPTPPAASGTARQDDANDADADAAGDRTVRDTISLSADGQKIVNLNRGAELAADLKTQDVGLDFAKSLQKAFDDIFRIGRLFTETIKTAFGAGR